MSGSASGRSSLVTMPFCRELGTVLAHSSGMKGRRCVAFAAGVGIALAACAPGARAIIVLGSGDPAFNDYTLHPPSGSLANSGGQFEGFFNGFLGTPIAPGFFLTANHIGGQVGDIISFRGVDYPTIATFGDPGGSDLRIWQVSGIFPEFAPLYLGAGTEVGQLLVAFGRGTQRGADLIQNGSTAGYAWGPLDFTERWGINVVADIYTDPGYGALLHATFDAGAAGLGGFECHLSDHDSGGGLFIQETGLWKLAGIHLAVDGPFYDAPAGGASFNAALFDRRGYYVDDGQGGRTLVSGPTPNPSGFYSTQVSPRLAWIFFVIALPATEIVQANAETYLALSYSRPNDIGDVLYAVEVSDNLQAWNSGASFTTLVSDVDQGGMRRVTVRDNAPQSASARRFIRLRVTRP